jgi:hypothetical protein
VSPERVHQQSETFPGVCPIGFGVLSAAERSLDRADGIESEHGSCGGLQYNYVRFNFGDFNSQLLTFPGLTDTGRVRLKTNNSLTIKLRNNFHLAFTFWDNFDSGPPPTAKKNELGISTGIGWSF